MPRHASLEERLWAQVDKTGECWIWTGGLAGSSGYGRVKLGKEVYAHRHSWMLANGQTIPAGMLVMHTCDNPPCVRPDHLRLGTPRENAADMARKGRAVGGSAWGNPGIPKLTRRDARVVRKLHDRGWTNADIGRLFEVHSSTIGMILRARTWTEAA